jgi:hypothetical protein
VSKKVLIKGFALATGLLMTLTACGSFTSVSSANAQAQEIAEMQARAEAFRQRQEAEWEEEQAEKDQRRLELEIAQALIEEDREIVRDRVKQACIAIDCPHMVRHIGEIERLVMGQRQTLMEAQNGELSDADWQALLRIGDDRLNETHGAILEQRTLQDRNRAIREQSRNHADVMRESRIEVRETAAQTAGVRASTDLMVQRTKLIEAEIKRAQAEERRNNIQ